MVERRLEELGLALPACPVPVAAYQPAQQAGRLIFVSGNTAAAGGELQYAGKVGGQVTMEEAYESAKMSALLCLSGLRSAVDLDRVRIVMVSGFINADPGFRDHPAVLNGASELIEAAFGERGKHARKAIGVSSLPSGASVEVELTAYIEDV